MQQLTLGLAVIALNEEAMLPGLLSSVEGAFDQVALLDTGSTDETVAVFQAWAARRPTVDARMDSFTWCDDFAAARNAADDLLSTDWTCWACADEEICGARNLRALAASLPAEVVGASFAWDYLGSGLLYRERLVRRGQGRFSGRVHETVLFDGPIVHVPPPFALWKHRRAAEYDKSAANGLRILRNWVDDEPDDPRALALAGVAEFEHGNTSRAIDYLRRYLASPRVREETDAATRATAADALEQLAAAMEQSLNEQDLTTELDLLQTVCIRPPQSWAQHPSAAVPPFSDSASSRRTA